MQRKLNTKIDPAQNLLWFLLELYHFGTSRQISNNQLIPSRVGTGRLSETPGLVLQEMA